MIKNTGVKYMKLALEMARKAKDKTYPNPMVGAVIVKDGKIVGKGYHRKAGESHAEVMAITSAQEACSGATMFVTLEPCNHYGKTAPCAQAIIDSGIETVNIAMKDPNPINSGSGIRRLKEAGISVNVGLCCPEAKALNRKYIKFITTALPYITVKLAQSIDGKIAARDGSSKWISSKISREYVKKKRYNFDAIVVGSNTVCRDDPFLLDGDRRGYNVSRVIVDTRLKIPMDSNLIKTANKAPVIVGTTELAPKSRVKEFCKIKGVEIISTRSKEKKVSLKVFFAKLAQKGIVNILVEGGGRLVGSLLDESLIDEVMFFIAPKMIGGNFSSIKGDGVETIDKAIELYDIKVKKSGKDILVRGLVRK